MPEKKETCGKGNGDEVTQLTKSGAIEVCEVIRGKAIVVDQACWSIMSGESPVEIDAEGYSIIDGMHRILAEIAESANDVASYLDEGPSSSESGGAS